MRFTLSASPISTIAHEAHSYRDGEGRPAPCPDRPLTDPGSHLQCGRGGNNTTDCEHNRKDLCWMGSLSGTRSGKLTGRPPFSLWSAAHAWANEKPVIRRSDRCSPGRLWPPQNKDRRDTKRFFPLAPQWLGVAGGSYALARICRFCNPVACRRPARS